MTRIRRIVFALVAACVGTMLVWSAAWRFANA